MSRKNQMPKPSSDDVDQWLALLPESEREQFAGGLAGNFSAFVSQIAIGNSPPINLPHPGVTAVVGGNNVGKSTVLNQIVSNWYQGGHPFLMLEPRVLTGMAAKTSGSAADALAWFRRNRHPQLNLANNSLSFSSASNLFMQASPDISTVGALTPAEGYVRREIANHLINVLDLERRRQAANETARNSQQYGSALTQPAQIFELDRERRELLNRLSYEAFETHLTFDNVGPNIIPRVGVLKGKAPRIDEVDHEYVKRLQRLPTLFSQGAGMVHMLGMLMHVIAATYPVLIIDEPEAFLHPPQARILGQALGKQAMENGVQVILGTHSRNILAGLLDVDDLDLTIVRLTRKNQVTSAVELRANEARELWKKPVVLYGDLLEGLFHRLVILCEAEGDCLFYAAALDAAYRKGKRLGIHPRDVLFLPSHGVAGMNKLAQILRTAGVTVVSTPDIDILRREDFFEFVGTMGGDQGSVRALVNAATNGMKDQSAINTCAEVLHKVTGVLKPLEDAMYTNAIRKEVNAKLRAEKEPWEAAKKYGTAAVKGDPDKLNDLLDQLSAIGICVVRAGELESFGHGSPLRKHDGWSGEAIDKGLHKAAAVRDHVRRLVSAGLALGA